MVCPASWIVSTDAKQRARTYKRLTLRRRSTRKLMQRVSGQQRTCTTLTHAHLSAWRTMVHGISQVKVKLLAIFLDIQRRLFVIKWLGRKKETLHTNSALGYVEGAARLLAHWCRPLRGQSTLEFLFFFFAFLPSSFSLSLSPSPSFKISIFVFAFSFVFRCAIVVFINLYLHFSSTGCQTKKFMCHHILRMHTANEYMISVLLLTQSTCARENTSHSRFHCDNARVFRVDGN